MISEKCNICGKEFRVEFEVKGQGQVFMLPGTVTRVRHCAGGNYVDVFGTITAFSEWIAPQNLVKAEPILSDPLES